MSRSNKCDFERMSMQMHRMLIAASIAKHETIAFALFNSQHMGVRPRLVINGPGVELRTFQGAAVTEGEREDVRWFWCRIVDRKLCVIPLGGFWVDPFGGPVFPAYSTTMPRLISRSPV